MSPLLLAYDGSEDAAHAIRVAAKVLPGAEAIVVNVWEPLGTSASAPDIPGLRGLLLGGLEELDREGEELSAGVAAKGAELANEAGLRAEGVSRRAQRRAWAAILELADERDVPVIVVGRRGLSGPERWLLGSVSSAILQRSERPVLVVPSEP